MTTTESNEQTSTEATSTEPAATTTMSLTHGVVDVGTKDQSLWYALSLFFSLGMIIFDCSLHKKKHSFFTKYSYLYIGYTKDLTNNVQSVFIPFHSKHEKPEFLKIHILS